LSKFKTSGKDDDDDDDDDEEEDWWHLVINLKCEITLESHEKYTLLGTSTGRKT
jgi:hypothetical protein